MIQQKDKCKHNCHYRVIRQDVGKRYFSNTGKPYVIEECVDCKREYVREL